VPIQIEAEKVKIEKETYGCKKQKGNNGKRPNEDFEDYDQVEEKERVEKQEPV
jgi:hypothetical protein